MDIPHEMMNIIRELCEKQDITITRFMLRLLAQEIKVQTGKEIDYKSAYARKQTPENKEVSELEDNSENKQHAEVL